MTDDGERRAEDATVRERRSDPKVRAPAPDDTPPTARMRTDDAPPTARMRADDAPSTERMRSEDVKHEAMASQRHPRGTTLGRYVVLELLGAGGMGEVYTAYDPALDRRIALKVIRPYGDESSLVHARGFLLAEAQALAKLAHPNVVSVYDVGTFGDDVYIAMEYIEGTTLRKWLAGDRAWSEIVAMFVAAGRGLEAAHAVGIVHRDFKPDNVIIGEDGRVRVIDFGIAVVNNPRRSGDDQPGAYALAGTPAFMAPEQFERGDIGPPADQFSFAVALYRALWKQHAFAGTSDAELKANVCEGRLIEPPQSAVPAAVRDAVLRGLAADPAARHPSMGALLAAITPPPRRTIVPYAIAGGATLTVAAALLVVGLGKTAAEPCAGFSRDLVGVWDPARRVAVRSRVRAEAWPAVERFFDSYATGWVNKKRAVCRATSVTREQSAAVLERRMACLDTRRRELDAAIAIVAAGGGASGRVLEIAGGLRSLAGCDNLAALAPIPAAPANEIRDVEVGLARIRAVRLAGDYAEARTLAGTILGHAQRLGWGSAVAKVLVERARAESADGDPKAARESLLEAIRRGDEADDSASQAAAWIELVSVEGTGLREPTEALRWAQHAEVALAKAGADQEQQAELLHNIAAALRNLDRNVEALDHERRALALFEHAFGPRHVRVANQRGSVSTSLRRVGKLDESLREAEAALALLEESVGARHPYVAAMLNNLALTYDEIGRLDDARRALERALAIREHELGKDHAGNANPLMNLVALERRAGRFEVAEALWQRAYDIRVASLGPNHADVTRALHGKLLDLTNRGLDDQARALVDEVVTRQRARTDAVELAGALSLRCELLRRAGKLDAAVTSCNEAIAAVDKTADTSRAVYAYAYAARLAAQRDQHAEAEKLIEQGRAALAAATRDKAVARGFFGWAAAHVAFARGRRAEAAELAKEARASLLSHGINFTYTVNDLDRLQ